MTLVGALSLLSKYAQTFPIFKETYRFWLFLLFLKEKKNFSQSMRDLNVKCVIASVPKKSGNIGPVFCIVHWNAPDFLILNIKQLNLIYPNQKIYVLDNGSKKSCLEELVTAIRQFTNVTLFSVSPEHKYPKDKCNHTNGLQFLLNYSAIQQDEFSVFLDQDCILCRNIDDLLTNFRSQKDLLLIGARDHVIVPEQHNWLASHFLRRAYEMVHPSLMIMQPKKIVELFGHIAFFPHYLSWEESRKNKWQYETYHSISYRARGHILYLETKMHGEIPLLTIYSYGDIVYAYHAWYSSQMTFLSVQESLDGIPVSLLLNIRKKAYEHMEQIHKSGISGSCPKF